MVQLLIVDDHPMLRRGLRSLLDTYQDIQVVGEARDGIEAVKLVGELRPRVVLMDIHMPKMDGVEATVNIMRDYPETIIIGLSAHATNDTREAMTRAGAAWILNKEVAVGQLLTTVRAAVTARDREGMSPWTIRSAAGGNNKGENIRRRGMGEE